MFLNSDQLYDLTGYRRRSNQIQWLRENGFVIKIRADGRPLVSRDHVLQMLGVDVSAMTSNTEDYEPDLEAVQ